jgi:hypothetical protein
MMNRSIVGLVFLAVLVTNVFSVEIEGFREFKWGNSPTSIEGKEFIEVSLDEREKTSRYELKNENVYIGTVDVDRIWYNFFDKKLYAVTVFYHGKSYFLSLKDTFIAKYGNGKQEDILGYKYSWSGKTGHISISFDPIKERGSINMFGKKVFDEYLKHKEQLAKQSVKDI